MDIQGFFDWAKARGLNKEDIARELGYNPSSIYRLAGGGTRRLDNFKARAILHWGDQVRGFFEEPGRNGA